MNLLQLEYFQEVAKQESIGGKGIKYFPVRLEHYDGQTGRGAGLPAFYTIRA